MCQQTEAQPIGETSAPHAEPTVQLQPSCKNDRATTAGTLKADYVSVGKNSLMRS